MNKRLSIIIITKDTEDLLKNLLYSILSDKNLTGLLSELIIVDNNSQDGTREMLDKTFPEIIYIRNEKNLGFAASANKGFFHSAGDYVLFLNSDTLVLPHEIEKMLDFLDKNDDVAICAPQLVYEDMRLQRSFAYVPKLMFEFIPKSVLEIVLPNKYKGKKSKIESPQDVESLIGAAFLVRRKVFEILGGFDERFFFFLEETDFCIRARNKGFRVVFFPFSKIIHLQGKTISKTWVKGRIEYNISLYKFIKKHHQLSYFYLFVCVRFIKSFVITVLMTVFPILLINRHLRRNYRYYLSLFTWHLKGCQDKEGIRN
ncbi:MAG: glycosyltransferase family 2 protein [Syntrophorhabdaceae bacterium]|nr:glycosyltransferase family 2 protein [Syntrophorhabdaceae bacterium]